MTECGWAAEAGRNVSQVLASSPARVFVADVDTSGRRPAVTVHTSSAASKRGDRRSLLKALRESAPGTDFAIKAHGLRALERPKSLQAFLDKTARSEIVFDPTAAFGRSQRLVEFSRQLRRELGERVVGAYWSSDLRVLYVSLDSSQYVDDGKMRVAALAETENAVRRVLRETCGDDAETFIGHVKVGFGAPEIATVPIDEAARRVDAKIAPRWARLMGVSALAVFVGLGAANGAKADSWPTPTDLPAVSALNGKVDVGFGVLATENGFNNGFGTPFSFNATDDDVDELIFGTGSVSIPLFDQLGAQIDVGGGSTLDEDHAMYGVGGHLFWRDPGVGLAGIIGSYTRSQVDVARAGTFGGTPIADEEWAEIVRLGLEGELYIDQFTVFAAGGVQFGEIDNASFRDGGFFNGGLTWYATEDLALTVGAETDSATGASFAGGAEWQPGFSGISGLTVFFDGAYADDDDYRALAGIRFYFGGEHKSLIRRHREDDPRNNLISSVASATNTGYID